MTVMYKKDGETFLPELEMPENETAITKYGLMRKKYLEEEKNQVYTMLVLEGKLQSDLLETQQKAESYLEELIQGMKEKENVTEELKAQDQLQWIQKMNNIQSRAEEIVLAEIICV